jgi:hypothetical protein
LTFTPRTLVGVGKPGIFLLGSCSGGLSPDLWGALFASRLPLPGVPTVGVYPRGRWSGSGSPASFVFAHSRRGQKVLARRISAAIEAIISPARRGLPRSCRGGRVRERRAARCRRRTFSPSFVGAQHAVPSPALFLGESYREGSAFRSFTRLAGVACPEPPGESDRDG